MSGVAPLGPQGLTHVLYTENRAQTEAPTVDLYSSGSRRSLSLCLWDMRINQRRDEKTTGGDQKERSALAGSRTNRVETNGYNLECTKEQNDLSESYSSRYRF